MHSVPAPPVLVVIAGPQASGKSTLATALGAGPREQGEMVALVELDQIAAMALPTLPSWEVAHRIFESTTAQWARSGATCVVAEGSGTRDEVAGLLRQAPPDVVTVTVVVTTPFDIAFARAQADPTRGVSRQHGFLSRVYARWADEMAGIDSDLLIDTSTTAVDEAVERIRAAVAVARGMR